MTAFSKLHAQNHKITELSNVFLYLVQNREICDTQTACDVFFEYSAKVKEHIELVDRELCSKLISYPDQSVKNTADRFLSGSNEIKRIFNQYLRDWCNESRRQLTIRNHEAFLTETEQMFALVLDRIQRETEHLYPLMRKVQDKDAAAA
ncbi:MAG TPA: hypothetical protein DDY14_06620 [Chromatiaceae bacterium]|jgi:hypothetical protein|nr:MAG: hypothetical protein N838_17190 [Thiohalocapsa sp. PB-PSB1]QQO52393.1 MAG: hypothetical protein N838_02310 [Thiohalocapsa sp. PB-PSB1]HBG94989.1 hypothetical protein [Chromatiaceae bacterium]HCS92939.1 hypothetical protein [Chromatiaceae bacterium]